jgi:hypothetical protein
VHGAITYADAGGGGVEVTWRMWGQMPGYVGGWFALLADSMVTPSFERSLEGLEQACSGGLSGRLKQGANEVLESLGS